jgi:hypothetical protein
VVADGRGVGAFAFAAEGTAIPREEVDGAVEAMAWGWSWRHGREKYTPRATRARRASRKSKATYGPHVEMAISMVSVTVGVWCRGRQAAA